MRWNLLEVLNTELHARYNNTCKMVMTDYASPNFPVFK